MARKQWLSRRSVTEFGESKAEFKDKINILWGLASRQRKRVFSVLV